MTQDQGAHDPDDLDFTDDERVMQIDEDRYVISADGPPKARGVDLDHEPAQPESQPAPTQASQLTQAAVGKWLAGSFRDTGFTYGFDATLAVDDEVVRHRLVSNDLPTTFETLLSWFVRNTTTNTRPEDALGILLSSSDLPVRYPPGTLRQLAKSHGLSPQDSIGDLLDVVDEDGIRLPPKTD